MDPDYPDDQLEFMLADSGAQVVVAKADTAARIGGPRAVEPMNSAASAPAAPVTVGGGDPAYIVYRSGSTGRPKGVIVGHAGLGNLVDWHQKAFGITESDRSALISSPGFDAAVWEIWPCLTAGASLHVPPERVKTDIALRDWLLAERITTTFVPTPLCEAVMASVARDEDDYCGLAPRRRWGRLANRSTWPAPTAPSAPAGPNTQPRAARARHCRHSLVVVRKKQAGTVIA
jgi:non-ribosomal peptide synthetase component F